MAEETPDSNQRSLVERPAVANEDIIGTLVKTGIRCNTISLTDSTVNVGNTVHYHGPVKIEQHYYTKDGNESKSTSNRDTSGLDHGHNPEDVITQITEIKIDDENKATGSDSSFRRRFKTRSEWFARPARGPIDDLLTRPAPYVVVGHTVCSNYTSPQDCLQQVRNIQTYHFTIATMDISYNFLVGGDGNIYEGRGWLKRGAHTKYFNAESIGAWFIGTFEDELPPDEQLEAFRTLLEEGVRIGALAPDYKMFLHRQLRSSDCPGKMLTEELMKWPHWQPYIEELYPRCA